MPENARQNVIVGLFVLVALVVMGVLIIWFGESPDWLGRALGEGTYTVSLHFDQLTGVEAGTDVRMAVGSIGRVESLGFRDPLDPGKGIKVVAAINKSASIPANAVAVVTPAGMFGRAFIMVSTPAQVAAAPPIPTDGSGRINGEMVGVLEGMVPKDMMATFERALAAVGNLSDALTPVAHDLHELMVQRPAEVVDRPPPGMSDITANLYTAVNRLDRTLRHIDALVGDPTMQSQVRLAVENVYGMSEDGRASMQQFRAFSEDLRVIGEDTKKSVEKLDALLVSTDQRFETMTRKLVDAADAAGRVLTQLDEATTKMNRGEGTIGRFLNDPRLYEEMTVTFQRLAQLATDMRGLVEEIQRSGLKTRF